MRKILFCLPIFFATAAQSEPPKVVTDILPVHGLVSAVMGDLGTPTLLIAPGGSAHSAALKPSGARALQSAQLIVRIGPELTPGLDAKIDALAPGIRDMQLLDIDGTHQLAPRKAAVFDDHEADGHEDHADEEHDAHAHDDDEHDDHAGEEHGEDEHAHAHGDLDPHAWLDPGNAVLWTHAIANTLSELDAPNAATYKANAEAAARAIDSAAAEVADALGPLKDRPYVVFHDAYQYFDVFFDTTAIAALMTLEAASPSVARVRAVQEAVVAKGAVCMFIEPQYSDSLVRSLQEAIGARVATIDPLGASIPQGKDAYPTLIRTLGQATADCLQPSG